MASFTCQWFFIFGFLLSSGGLYSLICMSCFFFLKHKRLSYKLGCHSCPIAYHMYIFRIIDGSTFVLSAPAPPTYTNDTPGDFLSDALALVPVSVAETSAPSQSSYSASGASFDQVRITCRMTKATKIPELVLLV